MPTKKEPPKRRRPNLATLPRQHEQKLVMQPQLAARKRILDGLHDAIGSCEDLFGEHGESCSCETCCLVNNAVGDLRIFRMLLEIT